MKQKQLSQKQLATVALLKAKKKTLPCSAAYAYCAIR